MASISLPTTLYTNGQITLSAITSFSQRPLTDTLLSYDLYLLTAITIHIPMNMSPIIPNLLFMALYFIDVSKIQHK